MEFVQAAQAELTKRKALLADQLLSELAGIVVSYAVTAYQLFEEAFLRRHFISLRTMNDLLDDRADTVLSNLQESKHILAETYLSDLGKVDMFLGDNVPLRRRVREALLIGYEAHCYRVLCYYRERNTEISDCNCQRRLTSDHIHSRLAMPF